MRRYLLFGGHAYDERGGIDDLIGQFDDYNGARSYAQGYNFDGECWWTIVDTRDGIRVDSSDPNTPYPVTP